MLLIVLGVIVLGIAAGFGYATYQVRRMRRIVQRAGGYDDPDPAATRTASRRRLALCGALGVVGIALIVIGAL